MLLRRTTSRGTTPKNTTASAMTRPTPITLRSFIDRSCQNISCSRPCGTNHPGSTGKHQRRTALPADILALPALHPVVPDSTHRMRGTGTVVAETLLPSDWHTGQIIMAGDGRFGTQRPHDRLPFPAMRPDSMQSVQHIGQVMRHFMRYSIGNIIGKVLAKDIRVVAYLSPGVTHTVHTCGPALQVKHHGRKVKSLPQPLLSTLDTTTGCSYNQVLLLPGNRFYRHVTLPVREQHNRLQLYQLPVNRPA